MIVKIELLAGNSKRSPTKRDINKNIEALQRSIDGKSTAQDMVLLVDTKSILEGIKDQLPDA